MVGASVLGQKEIVLIDVTKADTASTSNRQDQIGSKCGRGDKTDLCVNTLSLLMVI